MWQNALVLAFFILITALYIITTRKVRTDMVLNDIIPRSLAPENFSIFFLELLEHRCICADNSLDFKRLRWVSPDVIAQITFVYLYYHDTEVVLKHGLDAVEHVYRQSAKNLVLAQYSAKKVKKLLATMQRYEDRTYYHFERNYFQQLEGVQP